MRDETTQNTSPRFEVWCQQVVTLEAIDTTDPLPPQAVEGFHEPRFAAGRPVITAAREHGHLRVVGGKASALVAAARARRRLDKSAPDEALVRVAFPRRHPLQERQAGPPPMEERSATSPIRRAPSSIAPPLPSQGFTPGLQLVGLEEAVRATVQDALGSKQARSPVPTPCDDDPWMDVRGAAAHAGFAPATVREWCRKGLIDGAHPVRNRWRMRRSAVDRFLQSSGMREKATDDDLRRLAAEMITGNGRRGRKENR